MGGGSQRPIRVRGHGHVTSSKPISVVYQAAIRVTIVQLQKYQLIASCAWSLYTMPKDRLQELRASAPADYYRDSQVTLVVDTSINADEKSITVFLAKVNPPYHFIAIFTLANRPSQSGPAIRSPQSELWTGVSSVRTGVFSEWTGVFSEWTGVFSEWTNVSSERTGVFSEWTNVSSERTGVSSVRTGVFSEWTNVSSERTGVSSERTGVFSEWTGVSSEWTGVSSVRTGVCVSRVIAVYRVRDKCWPK
uniref:(California timema) hypothetical protein n=1 Tax=Timema californicum TaxID=61474 RepID=A0A7R9J010_TIMCA|nr:unnamed protein product [Timema californicum]